MRCNTWHRRVAVVVVGLGAVLLFSGAVVHAGKPGPANLVKKSRTFMLGPKAAVKPGDWAAYNMKILGKEFGLGDIVVRLKISSPMHSDSEHPLKPDQFWIEFEFTSPNEVEDALLAMKMLVEGDPRDPNAIKRVYLQGGRRLPLEVPLEYLESDDESEAACAKGDEKVCTKQGGKVRRFKPKKIYTKLGWLRATRVRVTYPDGKTKADFWVSKSVPIFQLVRAVAPSRMEMELDSYGQGALSRIDEAKAVPMPDAEELARRLSSMAF